MPRALQSASLQALRDKELIGICEQNKHQTARQIAWLETRSKQAAPQTLVVA